MSWHRRLCLGCFIFLVGCAPAECPLPGGVTSGSTGLFSIVTVGGKRKMFLPRSQPDRMTGDAVMAVVDIDADATGNGNGTLGAPGLIDEIDLGSPDVVTATGGDSSVIVGVAGKTGRLYFIDPADDRLTDTSVIPARYLMTIDEYVNAIAVDSAHQRAYLAMWNGMLALSLTTKQIVSAFDVPPSLNFAFDWSGQRLVAPFAACDQKLDIDFNRLAVCNKFTDEKGNVMTAGLNIIDLSRGDIYTYQDPEAVDTSSPLGFGAGSVGVDPALGRMVVPSDNYAVVVDVAHATHYADRTLVAPHRALPMRNLSIQSVAVEASSHLALFSSYSSSDPALGLADLTTLTDSATNYVQASLLPFLGDIPWSIRAMAVVPGATGATGGGPVGILVASADAWAVRVDLKRILSLPTTPASDASNELDVSDADVGAALTVLNLTTRSSPP